MRNPPRDRRSSHDHGLFGAAIFDSLKAMLTALAIGTIGAVPACILAFIKVRSGFHPAWAVALEVSSAWLAVVAFLLVAIGSLGILVVRVTNALRAARDDLSGSSGEAAIAIGVVGDDRPGVNLAVPQTAGRLSLTEGKPPRPLLTPKTAYLLALRELRDAVERRRENERIAIAANENCDFPLMLGTVPIGTLAVNLDVKPFGLTIALNTARQMTVYLVDAAGERCSRAYPFPRAQRFDVPGSLLEIDHAPEASLKLEFSD